MVTRGDVSLDVEDNRGPYDWPQLTEITADLLQFSVHNIRLHNIYTYKSSPTLAR